MLQRLHRFTADFPHQFWILFGGTLINSTGSGMVFPFLTLYLHQKLSLSMTYVGLLLALWSISSLVGQLLGGALCDQFGRKRLMATSLGLSAGTLVTFSLVDSIPLAVVVIPLAGFSSAMYNPARDAMIADLVGSEKRPQAYGLIRVVSNLGIAIGPAIGGFLASRSYNLSFFISAAATFLFFLIVLSLMHETKPATGPVARARLAAPASMATVLRDTRFIAFCAAIMVTTIAYSPMMTVLPVYMKDQFGLGESFFGWVMTTNAAMVVLLQIPITRSTDRFPRLSLIALGSILYGLGIASVFFGSEFPHFVLSMAVMTFGEMLVTPNMVAVTADLAPMEMRGRYMGMLGLMVSFGFGIGPLLGGLIMDQAAPRAVWPIMGTAAIAVSAAYLLLGRLAQTRPAQPELG